MKVAFLTNFIPPYLNTFFQRFSSVVDELVIYVSTVMEPNRQWKVDWSGLKVIEQKNISFKQMWHHPGKFSDQLFVHIPYNTISLLQKFQPDVVITVELGARTLMALLYKLRHRTVKIIAWARVSRHTEQGRGKIRHYLRKFILPRMDAIIVNGESGKQYIKDFGVPEERIHIVNLPVENNQFLNFDNKPPIHHPLRFLYVGQLIQRKGLDRFLAIFSKLLQENPETQCELWIVGDGNQRIILESQNYPGNLEIKFIGSVVYQSLAMIYHECDILIFPTLADEWGYVVNEALASGLPVFGSIFSQAVEELIIDGYNGWKFNPASKEQITSGLDQIFRDFPQKKEQMRENAVNSIKPLSVDYMVEEFSRVINQIT